MVEPLEPATLDFSADGAPWSTRFAAPYHPPGDALARSRRVFLDGNALPARWQGRERFVIVETGFGTGLNFLATWTAWLADPARCARLHFIAFEKHPCTATDLARAHARWPALASLSARLRADWPTLTPGMHRLWLDDGRVALTLYFGDASAGLARLDATVDAFYLDGFAPPHNPALWSARLCHQLATLAAPHATFASGSADETVRRHLRYAGAALRPASTEAPTDTLGGQFPGHACAPAAQRVREAVILGAGLAGSSVAQRLAARGWQVRVIDAGPAAGTGASGNLAGVLRPLPSLDDNRLARLTRAGTLTGLRHLDALARAGHPVRWAPTGVLHLARDPTHEARQRAVVAAQRPPADYLRFVDSSDAAALAGWPVAAGGWWFPGSGWVQPPSLCRANLAAAGIAARFNTPVERIARIGTVWQLFDTAGAVVDQTETLILANGTGIRHFETARSLPVRSARGQVSHLPAAADSVPRVVVCRLGYVSPAIDGVRCAGASFVADDEAPELRAEEHADNLAKLDFILPGFSATVDAAAGDGRVGFRPVSPDRLPMVGGVVASLALPPETPLADIPRQPGLYAVSGFGARGLVWSTIAAETLASRLDGDPHPIERDLADAIDPARFALRRARRSCAPEAD